MEYISLSCYKNPLFIVYNLVNNNLLVMALEIHGDVDQMTLTQMLASSTPLFFEKLLYSQIFTLFIPVHRAKLFVLCDPCLSSTVGGERGWLKGQTLVRMPCSVPSRELWRLQHQICSFCVSWPSVACHFCRLENVWRAEVFMVLFLGISLIQMWGTFLLFMVCRRNLWGTTLEVPGSDNESAANWSVGCPEF